MRYRLGMAAVAGLVILLASLILAARTAGSSPTAGGTGAATAQVTQPALSPIQQLAFDGGEGAQTEREGGLHRERGPPGRDGRPHGRRLLSSPVLTPHRVSIASVAEPWSSGSQP